MGLNQSTAISLSAGYAWQGKFVREALNLDTPGVGAFNLKRYIDPGDVVTANFNVTTEVGNTVIYGSFAYMSESAVVIDGIEAGRAGAKYNTNLTLNTTLTDRWSIVTNGTWSFAEKNEITVGGALVPEPKNSNSHVVIGSVEPGYLVTERLRVAANYSFLWRDENFYDQIENQFIPAKTKHTVDPAGHACPADVRCIAAAIELYCVDGFHRRQYSLLGIRSLDHAQPIDPDLGFHRRAADFARCSQRAIAHADRSDPDAVAAVQAAAGDAGAADAYAAGAEVPEGARRLRLRQDRDRRGDAAARRDSFVGPGVVLRHAAGLDRRAVHPVRAAVPGQRRAVRAADLHVRGLRHLPVEVG
jgi:hypothetical protein